MGLYCLWMYFIGMISSLSSLGKINSKVIVASSVYTISPTTASTSTTISGTSYKVYTLTNTTTNYYTITKTGNATDNIYYMCVGAGGSGWVCGGGAGQFREGTISVTNPQTITLSVAPTTTAGNRGSSSTIVFSVDTAKNVTSVGGYAGTTAVGGNDGTSTYIGGNTSSYGGGGGGSNGVGQHGSAGGGGDGGLPKKPSVPGISAVYPNTWWAAGGPGGYVAGNSYAGAGAGTGGFVAGKGIFLPGYNATTANNANAAANTGSGGGSSNPQNQGGSGIIVIAVPG